MAAAPQQGQEGQGTGVLWLIAGIFALGIGIWLSFRKQIVSFYFKIKLWEIKFFSLFTHKLDDVQAFILSVDPKTVPFEETVKVGQAVGEVLRIPAVIILFILAFFVFFGSSTRVFKRTYSMRDLVELEKVNWPQITPVSKMDLTKMDIDKGPWAMAVTPMQFCKKHKLLEVRRAQGEGLLQKDRNRLEVTLKRGLANKVFALQLGPYWQGTEKLPIHVRALFAIFAARYNGDSKTAADLLAQISASSLEKLDFTGANELCKKHENTKFIQKLINSHAYVLTVMASLLNAAREDGVQASADFLWLKPVDRRLWYMLNNVGRHTAFVEVAGPFAHWIAEKELGRRILVPMVEEATNALEFTLKEIIYQPEEGE